MECSSAVSMAVQPNEEQIANNLSEGSTAASITNVPLAGQMGAGMATSSRSVSASSTRRTISTVVKRRR